MHTTKSWLASFAVLGLIIGTICLVALWIGVWLPDVIFGQARVLSSVGSQSGHQFQIVQYWNGSDFYTTELEDLNANGVLNVAQIDWDDNKRWSCVVRVIEEEKKVLVSFPSRSELWEYRWDLGYFVAPYDRKDIPFLLNSRRRSTLTKPSKT